MPRLHNKSLRQPDERRASSTRQASRASAREFGLHTITVRFTALGGRHLPVARPPLPFNGQAVPPSQANRLYLEPCTTGRLATETKPYWLVKLNDAP